MSDKCPKCGESYHVKHHDYDGRTEELVRTGREYSCGSVFYSDDDEWLAPDCLRRQLAQKDRELEQARQSEARAWAVLARVKEWADSKYTIDNRKSIEAVKSNIETVINSLAELDTLLTDTPKVLAVVDGYRVDGPHPFNDPWFDDEPDEIQLNVWRDKPALGRPYTSVRVIVLRRDEEEK